MSPPLMGRIGEGEARVLPDVHSDRVVLRDRLRDQIRRLGGNPEQIEEQPGNCYDQTGCQIQNYWSWLDKNL